MGEPSGQDNTNFPVVSVIIPTFNSAATIGQTIASVLSQSIADLEVLVCDDGSNDATADLVESIRQSDSRVIFSHAEENFGGPAKPRNTGIDLARGEWIAFLDSDDLWVEHKLKSQLIAASRFGADFICSGIEDFREPLKNDELRELPSLDDWDPVVEGLTYRKLLLNNIIPTSTVLIKSKALRESRLKFVEDKQYVAVEDYELWLRVLSLPSIKALKIKEHLVFYRRVDTSISKNKIHMFLKVRRLLLAELRNRSPIVRQLLVAYLLCHYLARSIYYRLVLKRL